jgi:hypothetical protein
MTTRLFPLIGILILASACADAPSVLTEQVDARRYASELQAAFLKANASANRAVLADTDDASEAAAKDAMAAVDRAAQALAALKPVLQSLNYSEEMQHLAAFEKSFDEYRTLDAELLPLAVENTNLKAQKLSFGSAQEASDAFSAALVRVAESSRSADVEAHVAAARAAILEVQVIEARHIAESDEAAMDRMEQRMDGLVREAKEHVDRVRTLLPATAGSRLTEAQAALDRFAAINREILGLSRRNTNVRSLALSLGRLRVVAAECEDQLQALNEAVSRHQFQATR